MNTQNQKKIEFSIAIALKEIGSVLSLQEPEFYKENHTTNA